jgi:hypothetical protein
LQASAEKFLKDPANNLVRVRNVSRNHRANLVVVVALFAEAGSIRSGALAREADLLADTVTVSDSFDNETIELWVLSPVAVEYLSLYQNQVPVGLSSARRFPAAYLANGSAALKCPFDRLDDRGLHFGRVRRAYPPASKATFPAVRTIEHHIVSDHQMETSPAVGRRSENIPLRRRAASRFASSSGVASRAYSGWISQYALKRGHPDEMPNFRSVRPSRNATIIRAAFSSDNPGGSDVPMGQHTGVPTESLQLCASCP